MPSTQSILDPQVLMKIEGLELRAKRVVEGFVAGMHRSPYHGFSAEFAEHREYVQGDDLRYADWKAFAKTDRVFVKRFEEETNLSCYCILDSSESMHYQGPDSAMSKFEYAQCFAASIGYLVLRHRDSVGLATFGESVRQFIRASGNPAHIKTLVAVMEATTPTGKTHAGQVFHELAERISRRSIIIVFSDLFGDFNSMMAGLKHFRYRRHEVVVMHVLDRAELSFPFDRVTKFKGMESLPDVVTDPVALRASYLSEFESYQRRMRAGCREQGAEYILTPTDQPLDVVLAAFLHDRKA